MTLTEIEKQQIHEWNNTDVSFEKDTCIHQKLEQSSELYPNRIALRCSDVSITYKDLNSSSNILANQLLSKGIKLEEFVLVFMDRRIELLISIFGILKAGGVYVPISLQYPAERIASIISDTKATKLITSRDLSVKIPEGIQAIYVEDVFSDANDLDLNQPNCAVKANNLAYAIFTSGTTGRPKGVLIEHHSVLNRIGWMQKGFPINENDVLIQKTPLSFDVSIWELFWWSFQGASLVLLPNDHEKNPELIIDCVKHYGVSIIHFVPSMLNTFVKYLSTEEIVRNIGSLNRIFCSGEELSQIVVADFYSKSIKFGLNPEIINLYGPTEATVDVTFFNCSQIKDSVIPIGKPIDNTQIYILDSENNILPATKEGELAISGVNLARGYLNRHELTNEKFISIDVFGEQKRVYKTGDLGYFNSLGEVVYKGRIDNQIKLRGFRIELSEIDNILLKHANVAECACIVKDEKEESAHIVCFVVIEKYTEFNRTDITKYLSKKLPDYMIPSVFCEIKEMPLTINGKLNKVKLLELLAESTKKTMWKDGSLNNIERSITDLWRKLLKRPDVSVSANIFEMGGNSLLVAQLSLLIKKELNLVVDFITIMQYPTIQDLANYLSEKK